MFTYYDTSSVAKKITEDILHKIYTDKGVITGIWIVLFTVEVRKKFTGFQVATSQLMLGRRWLAIWVHSNSLIKNLTPFEDDAEIRLLNFLMYANSQKILLSRWLHSKLISTLKFLSNWKTMFWVISQEQHSIKTLEFTETNSYFYSFTYGKNIFSSSSY